MEDDEVATTKTFMNHVFNFGEDTKFELLNLTQYTVLGIVPVIALNKAMNHLFPETDDTKTTVEILLELVGQVLFIIYGIYFIHRLITYVPAYSGTPIPAINLFHIAIFVLVITLSLQTKIGQKGTILYERTMELWHGKEEPAKESRPSSGEIRVIQPISTREPTRETHLREQPPVNAHEMAQPQIHQPPQFDQMYQEPMAANDFGGGLMAYN
jgi:hypothetical protein